MSPYALVVDDFLPDFASVRSWADRADFDSHRSPVDDVVYPFICGALPESLILSVGQRAARIMGRPLSLRSIFMRLSPAGVPVPHQAHNDSSMGQYSLMLYMNRTRDCWGGTSLLRHRQYGFESQPRSADEMASWWRDCNDPRAWDVVMSCPMRANRAFIFPAELMHRAEPLGGFGSTAKDARLVLTAFFDTGSAGPKPILR